jgi:hypothetical protein
VRFPKKQTIGRSRPLFETDRPNFVGIWDNVIYRGIPVFPTKTGLFRWSIKPHETFCERDALPTELYPRAEERKYHGMAICQQPKEYRTRDFFGSRKHAPKSGLAFGRSHRRRFLNRIASGLVELPGSISDPQLNQLQNQKEL